MIDKNNIFNKAVYYIITLLLNIIPCCIIIYILKAINKMGPQPDPEAGYVSLAMYELFFFVMWILWLIHFISHASKKNISMIIIFLLNIPYMIVLGMGQISPIGIILMPFMLYYTRNFADSNTYRTEILITATLLFWFLFILLISIKRKKYNGK